MSSQCKELLREICIKRTSETKDRGINSSDPNEPARGNVFEDDPTLLSMSS